MPGSVLEPRPLGETGEAPAPTTLRTPPGASGRIVSEPSGTLADKGVLPAWSPQGSDRVTRAAFEVADAAARQAGVAVHILADPSATHEADRLLAAIWATAGPESPVPAHLMRAMTHS